ncbi:MAG: carboxypeptidase M32, partial [Anaerolineales bacterium]
RRNETVMEEKLNQLKTLLVEVSDLRYVGYLLGWDQQTYMPPLGAEARGQQMATIDKLAHIKFTSDEVGKLVEELAPTAAQLPPDSDTARLIKVTRRQYDRLTKVPAEMVAELAALTAMAFSVWQEARPANDFAKFQPYLEKIVDNRRRFAQLFAPYDHIYDPLLENYEPGMKTAEVRAVFNALRPQQVELIQAIGSRPQVDDSFLHQPYDVQKQWDFGVEVISKFGYPWERGRQDKAAHPFTTEMGLDDVRITTRVLPEYVSSALFSTMHEAGHGLYDLGVDPALARTPLAILESLALHESQSRMWENLVGRSLPFWKHFYPRLQGIFSAQLGDVDLMTFYKGINKVEPSLIRVEADEATYNLHIMLRLETEIELMEGTLQVKDLPEAWNSRMQDYLGLIPPDDRDGVLQDVHWSDGYFGYFATYALGNLLSLQLWEKINADIPDLSEQIERGQFGALLSWLRENVHRHGAKFEAQELIERITGSRLDPAPYMRYLKDKYSQIYGL